MKPITIRINRKKLRAMKLITAGLFLLAGLLWLDGRIRPVLTTVGTYQAQLLTTKSINDAVLDIISEENVAYNNIVTIRQGENGGVSSLSTDMVTMNRLKSEITNCVNSQLLKDGERPIFIPIGTLLGNELLAGRGPNIEFRVLPSGYIHSELYNEFKSAGINQTLHQIMLKIDVAVSVTFPLHTVNANVTTNVCIAETVIVGEIPQSYTNINGDKSDMLRLYNDYKAKPLD